MNRTKSIKRIKADLTSAINQVSRQKELFVMDSRTNFTRRKKLDFPTMMRFILQIEGSTIRNELAGFFHYKAACPSPSAFYQQRLKIKPEAFYSLFQSFTSMCQQRLLKGYRLLAADGSTVYTPRNKEDSSSYMFNGSGKKAWNCVHVNALYDLVSGIYVDALIQPGKKEGEQKALRTMLGRLGSIKHSIIIADRGYESFETVACLQEGGASFVIRVKEPSSNNGFLAKLELSQEEEYDILHTFKIAYAPSFKGKKKREKILEEGCKLNWHHFLHVSKDSPVYIFKPMRVVKCRIGEGAYEYLLTNLPPEEFTAEEIKGLYKMRWGIETSFRELKYALSLLHFHSKKTDLIGQEIFARFTMYNFSHMVASQLAPEVVPGKKHPRQLNSTYTVKLCREYFRNKIGPSDLKALMLRSVMPIRPDRHFGRKINKKQPRTFNYRIS